jgi:flagellar biosynthesis protein FlhF
MKTSFATATTREALADVVATAQTDVVIVDTAGRGEIDDDGVEASLAKLPRNGRTFHTLLCAPACVRAIDAKRIARAFANAAPTALCITKIDETDAPGGLLHAILATRLAISTLCTGPNVPDDIAAATAGAVIDMLAAKRSAS